MTVDETKRNMDRENQRIIILLVCKGRIANNCIKKWTIDWCIIRER